MIRLSREIRFALTTPPATSGGQCCGNSWAGWPGTNRIVPHLVLRCVVSGDPDPLTGYLCNIKLLDELLRKIVVEKLIPEYNGTQTGESIIQSSFDQAISNWNLGSPKTQTAKLESITMSLTPYLSFSIDAGKPEMIQLTQQFEFSAAHRLHSEALSDEENAAYFGKCNNLEGHGHNYVVEVTVGRNTKPCVNEISTSEMRENVCVFPLHELEAIVKEQVIDPFDHKHLNRDVEYFSKINPTVENIAIAIYERLHGQFGEAELQNVRVYETPKTWAEYGGQLA